MLEWVRGYRRAGLRVHRPPRRGLLLRERRGRGRAPRRPPRTL